MPSAPRRGTPGRRALAPGAGEAGAARRDVTSDVLTTAETGRGDADTRRGREPVLRSGQCGAVASAACAGGKWRVPRPKRPSAKPQPTQAWVGSSHIVREVRATAHFVFRSTFMWLHLQPYVCTTKPYAVHLLALLLDGIV